MYKVSERHIAADKEKERVRIEAEKAKDVGNCISSGKSDSFCRNAFGANTPAPEPKKGEQP